MADLTTLLSKFLGFLPNFQGSVGGALEINVTAVGNVGAGTDILMTYDLPANTLNVNARAIRITAWGTAANNSNPKTIALLWGSQTIMTQALTVSQAGTWRIVAYVVRTGTDTQDIFAELLQLLTTVIDTHTITAGTQDDGAAITIKCTGTVTDGGGGINNDDLVQEGLIVEMIG